jgi:hypothetical protein
MNSSLFKGGREASMSFRFFSQYLAAKSVKSKEEVIIKKRWKILSCTNFSLEKLNQKPWLVALGSKQAIDKFGSFFTLVGKALVSKKKSVSKEKRKSPSDSKSSKKQQKKLVVSSDSESEEEVELRMTNPMYVEVSLKMAARRLHSNLQEGNAPVDVFCN